MIIRTRDAMSLSAAAFGLAGVGLLFAPDLVGSALIPGAAGPLAQLLGAALLGFATMNWTARGMALGGIYGRAVVAANQAHAFIGALVLVRWVVDRGATLPMWVLTGVYLLAAVYFSWLMFFSSPGR